MFKNLYGKISEAINNISGLVEKGPLVRPFESAKNVKPDLAVPAPETLEKKAFEQEHFEGHEAECDFCLSESLENLNAEKLKEYFIFSEILGKPKSRQGSVK